MGKNRGCLVRTSSNKTGSTRYSDSPINGKIIVYLVDHPVSMKPLLDPKGKQQQILVSAHDLSIIGYID